MNLDELRTVRRTERQKDSLQHLRDTFYQDVADYIEQLKRERTRVADGADDPFSSPEVGRLTDEIETAEEVVEAVYERRVGKIVKLASFAAADMPTDETGLTAEERALFDDLVTRIKESRKTVLDTLAGERSVSTPPDQSVGDSSPLAETPSAEDDRSPGAPDATSGVGETAPARTEAGPDESVLTNAMSGASDGDTAAPAAASEQPAADAPTPPPETPPERNTATAQSRPSDDDETDECASDDPDETDERPLSLDADRTTVRITRDVGAILGVDEREYDLEREDVVTLPSANADPLIDRDAAERID